MADDDATIRRLRGEPDPPPLDEVLARQQIEGEVRGELEDQYHEEVADERYTALLAIRFWRWVGMGLALIIAIPLLGALTGLCVRFFRTTSGLW